MLSGKKLSSKTSHLEYAKLKKRLIDEGSILNINPNDWRIDDPTEQYPEEVTIADLRLRAAQPQILEYPVTDVFGVVS